MARLQNHELAISWIRECASHTESGGLEAWRFCKKFLGEAIFTEGHQGIIDALNVLSGASLPYADKRDVSSVVGLLFEDMSYCDVFEGLVARIAATRQVQLAQLPNLFEDIIGDIPPGLPEHHRARLVGALRAQGRLQGVCSQGWFTACLSKAEKGSEGKTSGPGVLLGVEVGPPR